jgi:glycosyltransferase involved in cell wall biosynthesis
MLPKVSILIPCYNAELWIAQAIDSALSQTYPKTEVIVVDDGSTDRSLEIIQGYGDRLRWETQPNQGGNITRNRLLELSTGEWLQYLDADDYLLPYKIANQMAFITSQASVIYDVIYSPSIFEYWEGSGAQQAQQATDSIPEPHEPWCLLALWHLPQTGSPLWRRQAIVEVGGWKADQPCCQEHELYLRLLMAGKRFEYFAEAASVYRQWSDSTVCKRDKAETYRQRLGIEDRMEQYLTAQNQLTPLRQQALSQARFECARLIWLFDAQWAAALIRQIQNSDPGFVPTGLASPAFYRWTYRLLGFSIAEQIAHLKRKLPVFS